MARCRGVSHQGWRLPEMKIPNFRCLGERCQREARIRWRQSDRYPQIHPLESVEAPSLLAAAPLTLCCVGRVFNTRESISAEVIEARPYAHAVVPGDRKSPPNQRAKNRLPHDERENVAFL